MSEDSRKGSWTFVIQWLKMFWLMSACTVCWRNIVILGEYIVHLFLSFDGGPEKDERLNEENCQV